jgi:hypothetical protein
MRRFVPSITFEVLAMTPSIPARPRDLGLRSILDFAHSNWDLHREVKTPWLKQTAELFRGRCAKLRMLMMLPSGIGHTAMTMQRALDLAHLEVLGALSKEAISEAEKDEIGERTNALLVEQSEDNLRQRTPNPGWDDNVLKQHKGGLIPLDVIQASQTWRALNALLNRSGRARENARVDRWPTQSAIGNRNGKPSGILPRNRTARGHG